MHRQNIASFIHDLEYRWLQEAAQKKGLFTLRSSPHLPKLPFLYVWTKEFQRPNTFAISDIKFG